MATDKRQVKRSIKQLQRFKTWQLVLLLVVALIITATLLRLNNIGMIERRNAVLAADEQGDTDKMRERLYALQRYSTARMNADTGIIYLEGQYQRDAREAIENSSRGQDESINAQADRTCKARHQGYSQAYILCVYAELDKVPAGTNAENAPARPDENLYRHEFISPVWSPDFAGFAAGICALLVLLIVARVASMLLLRFLVHRHYRSI